MLLNRLAAVLAFGCFAPLACRVTPDCHSPGGDDCLFSCEANADCIPPRTCQAGVCSAGGSARCIDADEDGYGVGDTSECLACQESGECAEDCDDSTPVASPALAEVCDGVDNDCDREIDESASCESVVDCPDESPYIAGCEAEVCVYRLPNQSAEGCDANPVPCVDGARDIRPEACF